MLTKCHRPGSVYWQTSFLGLHGRNTKLLLDETLIKPGHRVSRSGLTGPSEVAQEKRLRADFDYPLNCKLHMTDLSLSWSCPGVQRLTFAYQGSLPWRK